MCEIYLPQPAVPKGLRLGFVFRPYPWRISPTTLSPRPTGVVPTPRSPFRLFKNHLIAQMLIELILFRVRGV